VIIQSLIDSTPIAGLTAL